MEDKITVLNHGYSFKYVDAFWKEVDVAYSNGYRYAGSTKIKDVAIFNPRVRVVLEKKYKSEKELEDEITALKDEIKILEKRLEIPDKDLEFGKMSKKVEFLDFAEREGIIIPEDKITVAAIKKFITTSLKDK